MSRGYRGGGGGAGDNTECKVYVGDLSKDAEEKEVERAFGYYGRLKSVWIARNPPGFAFVEYEDSKDAEDAVRGLDGSTVCGTRIRVEHATGKVRPKPWLRGGGGGGGGRFGGRAQSPPRGRRGGDYGERCSHCGERSHSSSDCPRERRRRRSFSPRDRRRRSYSRSYSRSRSRDRGTSRRSNSRD